MRLFLQLPGLLSIGDWTHTHTHTCAADARPTVTIPDGPVVGTSVPKVDTFLGIPFAQSPPLRFAPPTSPTKWTEPLDASKLKPACMQQFNYPEQGRKAEIELFNPDDPTSSEDCLYLNIFKPSGPTPEGGWPILFWLFGGNLRFGDGGLSYYNGTSFAANQGVMVVTPNYRTNVFGFPSSPDIPADEQNAGLLDQRKALQWVQSNIAYFGGAPDKVTIFGESAGGYSVKQLLSNPPSPRPYRAAIMQSEGVSYTENGTATWDYLSSALNCTTAASELACVRAAPAEQIKSILEHNQLSFQPVFNNITASVNAAPSIASKKFGGSPRVPIMIGTNANEGSIFALTFNNLRQLFDTQLPGRTALHKKIAALYPPDEPVFPAASDIITDLIFQCPVKTIVELAAANGYPAWRYYFNASFPNFMPFADAGVFHASEVVEVFGTYNRTGATAQQIAISEAMQKSWADFAKDPDAGPGWQRAKGTDETIGVFGGADGAVRSTVAAKDIDAHCSVYADYLAEVGI